MRQIKKADLLALILRAKEKQGASADALATSEHPEAKRIAAECSARWGILAAIYSALADGNSVALRTFAD